jgi:hypothetical protein
VGGRIGGSFDPLLHSFALGLTSGVGERVTLVLGAVLLVIGTATGLAGGRASPSDERAGVGWIGRAAVGSQGAAFVDIVRTGSTGVSSCCSASRLLVSSCFPCPFASSSPPTAVLLSCCSAAVIRLFKSVTVVVLVVSREVVGTATTSAGFVSVVSSNTLGEAPSHFTRKCRTRVDQEATTSGELFSRFSYQSSASESALQLRKRR